MFVFKRGSLSIASGKSISEKGKKKLLNEDAAKFLKRIIYLQSLHFLPIFHILFKHYHPAARYPD